MVDTANSEFYSANVSSITTDFNVTPYYDDFDGSKNFYKILFKPGFAVQSRELTQIQSILQEQINRFGQHIFKEGSKVLGGKFNIDTKVNYVRVNDNDALGDEVTISKFEGQIVTGQITGISAVVNHVVDGIETSQNTKTLYVTYTNSNPSTGEKIFTSGETLLSNVGTLVTSSSNTTGLGSVFTIGEGIRFAKQHFIYHSKDSVVIDRYGQNPTCKVGFLITEEIIDASMDASLLDPALESSNFSAPGADRFKLTPNLVRVEINDTVGFPDYVNLFVIRDGVVQELYERPIYNVIRDELAKRTADESGDYYVRGFNVVLQEHLNTANNGGYKTLAEGGNSSLLSVQVEPGTAYVKGYEVNKLTTQYITTEKATDYLFANNQVLSSRLGTYVTVNEAVGSFNLDFGESIDLYDTANKRITDGKGSATSQTGNKIGSARIKSVSYDDGYLGAPDATINLHLFDIQMLGSNSFASVRSVYRNNASTADIGADVVLDTATNNASLSESDAALLYSVGVPFVRSIRTTDGSVGTSFTYRKSSAVQIQTDGTISLPSLSANETFPYGTGPLSSADERDIVISLDAPSFNVSLGNALSGNNFTVTVSGLNTRLNAGDRISFSGNNKFYVVSSVNSTSIIVNQLLPTTFTTNTIYKAFNTGDLIGLSGYGNTGSLRSATATPTSLVINLEETFDTSKDATISYNVVRTSAREISKTYKSSRYVRINCATHPNGNTGPYSLGVSDVYKIRSIRSGATAPANNTSGTDVTSAFIFDNGQRDDFYGHASITPKSTQTGNNLLIEFDYFEPDFTLGAGYFSIDSYPVNDVSPTSSQITTAQIPVYTSPVTGIVYDLRDYMDFRPVYENKATDAPVPASATTNPAAADTLKAASTGLRMPTDSEQITFDYSYYLARVDMVAIDKDANLVIIKGTPASTPITPIVDDKLMSLARLYIKPYPSISLTYAKSLNRTPLGCLSTRTSNIRHTMRDIGVLKTRIESLEDYVSLNTLQKNALDLKILDADGLDRFKNGIFVDTFADHTLGQPSNPDYSICVDPRELSIRPLYEMNSFGYNYVPGSGSNIKQIGDFIMLDYTETELISQNNATTFRNVETTSYRFVGNLYLDPEIDFWVDPRRLEAQTIEFGNPDLAADPMTTVAENWIKITGGGFNELKNALIDGKDDPLKALIMQSSTTITGSGGGNTLYPLTINGQPFGLSNNDKFDVETAKVITKWQELVKASTSIGNRIVDASLIPNIRPQSIAIEARGLKANTKHFVFFDGQDMTSYVTPALSTQNNNITVANTNAALYDVAAGVVEGDDVVSNSVGRAYLNLRIPSDDLSRTFRVGTKEVVVTDSPTNEDDATSFAKSYFVAQGIQLQQQETILSTRQVVNRQKEDIVTRVKLYDNRSCMAYSFVPKCPNGEDGVFLSSVDVYFAAKDPEEAVWFEIREMDNSGNITRNQVPMSRVWLEPSQVSVSDDATVATNVKFDCPIFLFNDIEYAFVIHTDRITPNYYMWVSVLGQTDVTTKQPVNQRGLRGNLFTTNNDLDWDIVPRVDLKCRFNRCKFNSGSIGQAVMGSPTMEFITANTVTTPLTNYGEIFLGVDRLTLSGSTVTPVVGDRIIGTTSNVNTSIVSISGSSLRMENNGYLLEPVTIKAANGTTIGSASIASKDSAGGYLYSYKSGTNTSVIFVGSNGKFFQGDTMKGTVTGHTATVQSIDKFVYSTIQFEPIYLNFSKTSTTFEMKTRRNSDGALGSYLFVDKGVINYFTEEKVLQSATDEAGQPSNQVRATLLSSSDFLSPVIDLRRSSSVYVKNLINSNTAGETGSSGGGLKNKYISQIVTLAEGQDAEDVKVILTSYRPSGSNSDIKVYMKISNAEDAEPISRRNWIELEYEGTGASVYSSVTNRNNFKEYSFKFPDSIMTGTNDTGNNATANVVQYTNSANTTFTGYKQFQIKIGLQSDNSAIVPRVADLRVIALQK